MTERTSTGLTSTGRKSTGREESGGTVIELLLREPEIVAWLEPRDDTPDDDYDPPQAA